MSDQTQTRRHIGGSILPSSDKSILVPMQAPFGLLQVRALPDLDTHALFLTHDRGESMLVMHRNGYSCHLLAEDMLAQLEHKVRRQRDYILACGGLAQGIDFILGWMRET